MHTYLLFKLSLAYCFRANPKNIHITGQARTDCIFTPSKNALDYINKYKAQYQKIILYTPTYKERKIGNTREIKKKFNNIFYLDDFDYQDFCNYLDSNNILFLMKPHPQDEFFYRNYVKKTSLPQNIKIIFDSTLKDNNFYLYEIFNQCDLMISDYSSITIDWLITKKPIIYLSVVVDEYIESRGMCLEDNYQMLMLGGNKVASYTKLILEINNCLFNKTHSYYDDKSLSLLHKYFDGNSCKRIYNIIKTL